MKLKPIRWTWLLSLLVLAVLLSACSSGASRIGASSWPGYMADEDTVYVSYGTNVMALKAENGNQVWRYPEEASVQTTFYAAPVLTDGELIVGDYQHTVYSLDEKTGSVNWTFSEAEGRFIGSVLAMDNGLILAPSADGNLYALDGEGSLQWTFEESSEALWSAPVTDGERVYLASMDHYLYAFEIDNNRPSLVWKTDLGGAVVSSPALGDDGMLYVGTMTQEMLAVSVDDGDIAWRFGTEGAVWASPLVHEGVLYFGDLTGRVYAVDAGGNSEWTLDLESPVIGKAALLDDGFAIVLEVGGAQAVNFNGSKLWNHPIDEELHAGPILADEYLVVGATKGDTLMFGLDPVNGNERWSFSPSK